MKSYRKYACCFFIVAFVMTLFSCRNLFAPSEQDNEPEFVNISFSSTIGRSAKSKTVPSKIENWNLSNFVLTGHQGNNQDDTIRSWSDYASFSSDTVQIKPGSWSFTLSAISNSGQLNQGTFKGTLELSIDEDTELLFVMKPDSTDNALFVLRLSWPKEENTDSVSVSLTNLNDSSDVKTFNPVPLTDNTYNNKYIELKTGKGYGSQNSIADGNYLLKCSFSYKGLQQLVFTNIVEFYSNYTTTVEENFETINNVYQVTFDYDEADGFTLNKGEEEKKYILVYKGSKCPEPSEADSDGGLQIKHVNGNPKTIWYWNKETVTAEDGGEEKTVLSKYEFNSAVNDNITLKPYCVVSAKDLASYIKEYAVSGENVRVVADCQLDPSATETVINENPLTSPNSVYFWGKENDRENAVFYIINNRYEKDSSFGIGLDFSEYESNVDDNFNTLAQTSEDPIAYLSGLTSFVFPDNCSVGNYGFYKCTSLRNVTLGNEEVIIGDYAFYYNFLLENLNMDEVTSIGDSAFFNCQRFKFSLTNKIVSIGQSAFRYCSSIDSVYIPKSVESIGRGAFSDCENITTYTVAADNERYGLSHASEYGFNTDELKEANALIDVFNKTLIAGCSTSKIPDKIESIEDSAFSNCAGLTSVKIPDSVTSIGWNAFSGCKDLVFIEIPVSVTLLHSNLFYSTEKLEKIYYGGTEAQWAALVNEVNTGISDKVRIICNYHEANGYAAYIQGLAEGTEGVITITLTDEVQKDDLVSILNAIASKNYIEFKLDMSAATVSSDEVISGACGSISGTSLSNIKTLYLPSGITGIASQTFQKFNGLSEVFIPESVGSIGNKAFYLSSNTKVFCETASKPESWSNEWYAVTGTGGGSAGGTGGPVIVWNACNPGTNDPSVNSSLYAIASVDVTTAYTQLNVNGIITDKAISSLAAATKNTASEWKLNLTGAYGVTEIKSEVFENNNQISSIILPDSVIEINENAFRGCSLLEEVILPEGVGSISKGAFNSSGLKTIFIPKTVTSIGENAFGGCANLSVIYYEGSELEWENIMNVSAAGIPEDCSIIFNGVMTPIVNAIDIAKNATSPLKMVFPAGDLSDEATKQTFLSLMQTVSWNNNLDGCEFDMSNMTVSASDQSVILAAFSGVKVASVSLPNGIDTINSGTLSNNNYLTSITLPSNLSVINSGAFSDCSSLESIMIPNTVTYIGENVFSGCTNLKTITIPGAITQENAISDNAFRNLQNVVIDYGGTNVEWRDVFKGTLDNNVTVKYAVTLSSIEEATAQVKGAEAAGKIIIENQSYSTNVFSDLQTAIKESVHDGWELDLSYTTYSFDTFGGISMDGIIQPFIESEKISIITLPKVNISDGMGIPNFGGFTGNNKITTVNIPYGYKDLGSFKNCSNLSSVSIPSSITTNLTDNCFMGCDNLKDIYYSDTMDTFKTSVIYRQIPSNVQIHCTDGDFTKQ